MATFSPNSSHSQDDQLIREGLKGASSQTTTLGLDDWFMNSNLIAFKGGKKQVYIHNYIYIYIYDEAFEV